MMKSVSDTLTCCKTVEITTNTPSEVLEGQAFLCAKVNEKELTFEFEKTIVIYRANDNSKFSGEDDTYAFIPKGSELVKINVRHNGTFIRFGLTTEKLRADYSCVTYNSSGVWLESDNSEKCGYEVIHIPNVGYISEQEKKLVQKRINEEKINELDHLLIINAQEKAKLAAEKAKLAAEKARLVAENKDLERKARFFY